MRLRDFIRAGASPLLLLQLLLVTLQGEKRLNQQL